MDLSPRLVLSPFESHFSILTHFSSTLESLADVPYSPYPSHYGPILSFTGRSPTSFPRTPSAFPVRHEGALIQPIPQTNKCNTTHTSNAKTPVMSSYSPKPISAVVFVFRDYHSPPWVPTPPNPFPMTSSPPASEIHAPFSSTADPKTLNLTQHHSPQQR